MAIGLFFFIRASVKDRTQQIKLIAPESLAKLLDELEAYFQERAYQMLAVDPKQNRVTFQGFVRPSWFLTIFLSILAAFGLFCLSLILAFVYPSIAFWFWILPVLSPLAGIFYWRKAGRWEKVLLEIKSESENLLIVTAHRDELIQLQAKLSLQVVD
jgi:Cofactor assembly of complex C subunit B